MPASRHTRQFRLAAFAMLCTAAGIAISLEVALAASALRPTDGYPNVFKVPPTDYRQWYFLPQHRHRTPDGDIFVDMDGGAAHTSVNLMPVRDRGRTPEDAWLFTTYPYPENVDPQTAASFGNPSDYSLPSWAAFPVIASTDHRIVTSAWGWPMRCLKGVERTVSTPGRSGKPVLRSTLHWYWVCGHGGQAYSRIRRIPLGVIPAGLAIDTLLYSAAAAVLLAGGPRLAALRARSRRRRGRCPQCLYDLSGGSGDGCPECGWGRDQPPAPAPGPR